MNAFKTCFARIYQKTVFIVQNTILHVKEPIVYKGEGLSNELHTILKQNGISDTLVVVDDGLFNVPFTKEIIKHLEENGIRTSVFHDFRVNPTIKNVEEGLSIYVNNKHNSIVGLGGGSSLDTAKMIGARATNVHKSVEDMKGILKVSRKLPLLIAIPTTAGTGSETTLAAVIIDDATRHKYPIEDPKLTPKIAVLDPKLLVGLPGSITSTTGMDALTHAVEAYTNHARTKKVKQNALDAIKLIYENLLNSYEEPTNLTYRNNMQVASYKAGVAFTNGYVGYVHALAHALGGKYNIAHGLANALILPTVLKAYDKKIYRRIAKIYDYISMGDKRLSKKEKTEAFISWIYDMNRKMNIKYNLNDLIKEEDIKDLTENSYKEGFPLYPCPKMFNRKEVKELYYQVKEENRG